MTRLLGGGVAIQATADHSGTLESFVWRNRRHATQHILDSWRVDMEWWRWRIWREYFHLTTDTGLLVVVYQDLLTQQWFLQRVYD